MSPHALPEIQVFWYWLSWASHNTLCQEDAHWMASTVNWNGIHLALRPVWAPGWPQAPYIQMTSYCSSKIGFGPRLSQMTSYHSSKIRLSSLITPYLAALNVDSNYVITSCLGLKNKEQNKKRKGGKSKLHRIGEETRGTLTYTARRSLVHKQGCSSEEGSFSHIKIKPMLGREK